MENYNLAQEENSAVRLSDADLFKWLPALRSQPHTSSGLTRWLEGPLRDFFPFEGLYRGHGELIAGEVSITHWLAVGHDAAYLQQVETTFELGQRGSLAWWIANRQPFYIDPGDPPPHTTAFEVDEIRAFGLRNVAAHGVLNVKANAGVVLQLHGRKVPLVWLAS